MKAKQIDQAFKQVRTLQSLAHESLWVAIECAKKAAACEENMGGAEFAPIKAEADNSERFAHLAIDHIAECLNSVAAMEEEAGKASK